MIILLEIQVGYMGYMWLKSWWGMWPACLQLQAGLVYQAARLLLHTLPLLLRYTIFYRKQDLSSDNTSYQWLDPNLSLDDACPSPAPKRKFQICVHSSEWYWCNLLAIFPCGISPGIATLKINYLLSKAQFCWIEAGGGGRNSYQRSNTILSNTVAEPFFLKIDFKGAYDKSMKRELLTS